MARSLRSDRLAFKNLNEIKTGRVQRRILRFAFAALTGVCLVLAGVGIKHSGGFFWASYDIAVAQRFSPSDVAKQVYQRLPDFPQENQYVSKETGKVATDNTLANRLIRYHIYVKNRPPIYRLDWKMTLADYLGANEYLREAVYPGYDTLQKNPMEGDRTAINRLNRSQREALINVLVTTFDPKYNERATPTPVASPKPPTNSRQRATPTRPKPGDAQLLKP